MPFELPVSQPLAFPERIFDIRDFGAVGNGRELNTIAFRCAVKACHRAGGGMYVENIHMANLRRDAILITKFYESSTAPARSKVAPVFRDIHLKHITCVEAEAAVTMRGLPEKHIERVTLEHLRLRALKGIHCDHVDSLTLRDVRGTAVEKPLLECTNVYGLYVLDTDLKQIASN